MESDIIRAKIQEKFDAPLPEFYKRRIVFWQDEDGDGKEMIDTFEFSNVKILKLTGTNNFAAKKQLLEDDPDSNYLVYNPVVYSDLKDNWLLDVELYSEEFRADVLSLRMDDLGIPSNPSLRRVVKLYSKFFENKDRLTKLKKLGTSYTNPGQIHLDVLAVLAGTNDNTPAGIIKAVLMAGLDDSNSVIDDINKFGDIDAFWTVVSKYVGYAKSESNDLLCLAAHLLVTTLSVNMKEAFFSGLETYVSEIYQSNCYSIIHEWMHSEDDDSLYEICREIEDLLKLESRFEKCEVYEMLECDCFPCINEAILRRYMREISENVIKAEEIVSTVEKRRSLKWYKRVKNYYDGILHVAKMQQFYQENIVGFHSTQYKDLWKKYQSDYYVMDTYYRQFHVAFGLSLSQSNTNLEDSFKGVADYVENIYKNWYLQNLSLKWTELSREELERDGVLASLDRQDEFYMKNVAPATKNGGKVFVVVSDALRYEVAAQLSEELIRDTKGTSEITALQSVCPSITKYGMAALLPHKKLEITDDCKVFCDGMSTEGTDNRNKILQANDSNSIALRYKDLLAMKKQEKRDAIAGKNIIYIYHNKIDSTGEALATEDQVFEMCDQTIAEIKNLVRSIVNDMNGTNILITADHGFLYSYNDLEVADKAEKDYVTGALIEVDRRYIISDKNATGKHLLSIPMKQFGCNYMLMVPQGIIRFKSGGGQNYVHGGTTLQEMMVPLITFKNVRVTSKKFVETTKAKVELFGSSHKITNNIFSLQFFQKEPVGGKIESNQYSVFFTDSNGNVISDVQKLIADKESSNDTERTFKLKFNLKALEFKNTEDYYLNITEVDGLGIPERIPFKINIAFAGDFDF